MAECARCEAVLAAVYAVQSENSAKTLVLPVEALKAELRVCHAACFEYGSTGERFAAVMCDHSTPQATNNFTIFPRYFSRLDLDRLILASAAVDEAARFAAHVERFSAEVKG